jgi:hypothetical protein
MKPMGARARRWRRLDIRMECEVQWSKPKGICKGVPPLTAHTSFAGWPGREAARRSIVTIRPCGIRDRLLGRRPGNKRDWWVVS